MTLGAHQLIPSKRFAVWSRLYKRFLLEPFPAVGSNSALSPVIHPTTDADRLLKEPAVRSFTVAVAGTGNLVLVTVPLGERWTVWFIEAALASGTWTHNRMDIGNPAALRMIVNNYTQTATSELFQPANPLPLDELWTIRINVDTFSGAGNAQLTVFIEVEDAF